MRDGDGRRGMTRKVPLWFRKVVKNDPEEIGEKKDLRPLGIKRSWLQSASEGLGHLRKQSFLSF